jgi:hypothetical protein
LSSLAAWDTSIVFFSIISSFFFGGGQDKETNPARRFKNTGDPAAPFSEFRKAGCRAKI